MQGDFSRRIFCTLGATVAATAVAMMANSAWAGSYANCYANPYGKPTAAAAAPAAAVVATSQSCAPAPVCTPPPVCAPPPVCTPPPVCVPPPVCAPKPCEPTWDLCCVRQKVACISKIATCLQDAVCKCRKCDTKVYCAIGKVITALCKLEKATCSAEAEQAYNCLKDTVCALGKAIECSGNAQWACEFKKIDCAVKELTCCRSCGDGAPAPTVK